MPKPGDIIHKSWSVSQTLGSHVRRVSGSPWLEVWILASAVVSMPAFGVVGLVAEYKTDPPEGDRLEWTLYIGMDKIGVIKTTKPWMPAGPGSNTSTCAFSVVVTGDFVITGEDLDEDSAYGWTDWIDRSGSFGLTVGRQAFAEAIPLGTLTLTITYEGGSTIRTQDNALPGWAETMHCRHDINYEPYPSVLGCPAGELFLTQSISYSYGHAPAASWNSQTVDILSLDAPPPPRWTATRYVIGGSGFATYAGRGGGSSNSSVISPGMSFAYEFAFPDHASTGIKVLPGEYDNTYNPVTLQWDGAPAEPVIIAGSGNYSKSYEGKASIWLPGVNPSNYLDVLPSIPDQFSLAECNILVDDTQNGVGNTTEDAAAHMAEIVHGIPPAENELVELGEPYFYDPETLEEFGDWRMLLRVGGWTWNAIKIKHASGRTLWTFNSEHPWTGHSCKIAVVGGRLSVSTEPTNAWAEGNFCPGATFWDGGTKLTEDTAAGDTHIHVVSTVGFPDSGSLLIDETNRITYTAKTSTTFTGCSGVTEHHLVIGEYTWARRVDLVGPWLCHYRYVDLDWTCSNATAGLRVHFGRRVYDHALGAVVNVTKWWDLAHGEHRIDLCRPHGVEINGEPVTIEASAAQQSLLTHSYPRSAGHNYLTSYVAGQEAEEEDSPLGQNRRESEWYWGMERVTYIKFTELYPHATYTFGTVIGRIVDKSDLLVSDQGGWRDDRAEYSIGRCASGLRTQYDPGAPGTTRWLESDEVYGHVICDGAAVAELPCECWSEILGPGNWSVSVPPLSALESDAWKFAMPWYPQRPERNDRQTIVISDAAAGCGAVSTLSEPLQVYDDHMHLVSVTGFDVGGKVSVGGSVVAYRAVEADTLVLVQPSTSEAPVGAVVYQLRYLSNQRDVGHLCYPNLKLADLTTQRTVQGQIRTDKLWLQTCGGLTPLTLSCTKRFGEQPRGLVFDDLKPRAGRRVRITRHGGGTQECVTDGQGAFEGSIPRQPDAYTVLVEALASDHHASIEEAVRQRRRTFCALVDSWPGEAPDRLDLLIDRLTGIGLLAIAGDGTVEVRRTFDYGQTFEVAVLVAGTEASTDVSLFLAPDADRKVGLAYSQAGSVRAVWSADWFETVGEAMILLSNVTHGKARINPLTGIMLIAGWRDNKIVVARSFDFGATAVEVPTPAVPDVPEGAFALDCAPDSHARWCIVYKDAAEDLHTRWSADNGLSWVTA